MILKKSIFTIFYFLLFAYLSAQPKLIGVTSNGGNEFGTIYKTDENGNNLNNIHLFDGISGANPRYTQLTTIGNQTLYGLSSSGGKYNNGVLFEYNDSLNTYTKKFDFSDADGSTPTGSLTYNNGKLYGLTSAGGNNNYGVIFEYTISNQSYKILAHFNGTSNGRNPFGSVSLYNNKLYGLTYQGGVYNAGVLFEYDLSTDSLIAKVDLDGTNSGRNPFGSLSLINNKLYGMTFQGGQNNFGIIFEYSPSNDSFAVKFNFNGTNSGSNPYGELELAPNGLLYGMTFLGGSNNLGTLFEFNTQNDSFVKRIDFDGFNNGRNPFGKLTHFVNGIFYGLTSQGGNFGQGTFFEFNSTNSTLNVLVNFNGNNGRNPFGSVVLTPNQKLYGLTNRGGLNNSGVIFEYEINSNSFNVKKHLNQANNGYSPQNPLINPYAYTLFGTTALGGINQNNGATNMGTLFEFDLKNDTFYKRIDFSNTTGYQPVGKLCYTNQMIYGVNRFGGNTNDGTVYEYNPNNNQIYKRADFNYNTIGAEPVVGLTKANDGFLYGMTTFGGINDFGTLFKFNPNNYQLSKLIDFDDTFLGFEPNGELFNASNNKLYGLNTQGGSNGLGVLFEVDVQNQTVNKLINFNNNSIGYLPTGNLVEPDSGQLIGLTIEGGNFNKGVLFSYQLSNNSLSVLHHFDTIIYPTSSSKLTIGNNNRLFCTSNDGGNFNLGQLFYIDLTNYNVSKTYDYNFNFSGRPSGNLLNICLPTESTVTISACDSLISPSSKYIFKQSGNFKDTIKNIYGCDSFINIQLTILQKTYQTITVSECESYLAADGKLYQSSGQYIAITKNYLGCDSIITINLNILNTKSIIDTAVCNLYIAADGSIHKESKQFTVIIPNANNCDSIIEINLKIKSSDTLLSISSCRKYIDPIGIYHFNSDTFQVIVPNYLGCDSSITIQLSITKPNVEVVSDDTMLTATANFVQYQWYQCSPEWLKIDNATNKFFKPQINGEYAVEIDEDNCKDTSDCIVINQLNISPVNFHQLINIYPNPSNGVFYIHLLNINGKTSVELTTLLGQKIDQEIIDNTSISKIDFSKHPQGVYLLKIKNQQNSYIYKMIIE